MIDGVSGTEERSAYLPLKRIQPANTRGQRWQAWRMRAAFSRRSGSTCREERTLCLRREGNSQRGAKHFTLHTHKRSSFLSLHRRILRHSRFLCKPQKQRSGSCRSETYVCGVDGPQAAEDVMKLRGARLKVRQVLSPAHR